ncbi:MAG: AzlD domain-containing protein [Actinomycetota bacterium]
MSWTAIIVLASGAYLFKLSGLFIGNRLGDGVVRRGVELIPPALFCALIALQTFADGTELVLDARVVGLLVAVVATLRRVPFLGVIILAMIATALTRVVAG